MAPHRHQATWRSLIFNRRYLDNGTANPDNPANLVAAYVNSDYYLDSLDISRVSVQDYREMRQFLEGAEPNEAYEGVRALNGVGRIVAADVADLEDKAWALNEAMSVAATRIAAQATDPVGVLPFSFKRDTAPTTGVEKIPATKALRFYCRPGPGRPVAIGRVREGLIRPFSFQLIAFDPFAYDETETQTTSATPWVSHNVTNPGNVYTRPKIRVTFSGAGLNNLTITNSTTGKSVVLDCTASANNEVWQIDVARGTIVRVSDNANRYSARVSGFMSDLWLQPGVNACILVNTTNVASVRYDFRGAYA
jgi:hypothetical protein